MCADCWAKRREGVPVTVPGGEREMCCYCYEFTDAGIFVREDPSKTPCKATGGVHHGGDF